LSRAVSPSTQHPYGVALVCEVLGIARSTYYDHKAARENPSPTPPKKRGPKTKLDDAALVVEIRQALKESHFTGEGHRKAWARLRFKGIRTSQKRVLRLMRENGLLAPPKARRVLGPRTHDGTITTDAPDVMWGTDATATYNLKDGYVTVFAAVDHCTSECVGIHVAKYGSRFEALEPIRQGVAARFGSYAEGVVNGLQVRHDHGSQYTSDHFQRELAWLGAESSPSFVRAPEGNGVAERFFRTLKEQLLWVSSFETVEELRLALLAWVKTYNEQWLVARHGYRSPAQVRRDLAAVALVA
jgi:transposase InsO family protein